MVQTVYKCANGSVKTTELCLKKNLLKDYDTGVRPVAHHSNQTTVYMALFPMRISIVSNNIHLYIFCCLDPHDRNIFYKFCSRLKNL